MMNLFRGLRNEREMELMRDNLSAGGVPANEGTTAPTEKEMMAYIRGKKGTAGECAKADDNATFTPEIVEFTSEKSVARSFGGRSRYYAEIIIEDKYVRKMPEGSPEFGYLIKCDAPLSNVRFEKIEISEFTGCRR